MRDVLVIGAGPAGLTAGIYAARAGLTVDIYEKDMPGGQAGRTDRVENYPGFASGIGGPELCMAMAEQAERAGAALHYEGVAEIDCAGRRVRTAKGWREAVQLILALGARPRLLGVPGEKELTGRGVSYCATCDGALYRGRRVAVIGGGNSAAEEALYLANLGCEVLLVHRRGALRAERAVAQRVLENPRIRPLWNEQAAAFEGEKALCAVKLASGAREEIAAAFVSIGREPDTALVRGQLALDAQGFIAAGEDCRTGVPGVFAAGDARAKRLRQIVTAAADGAVAASQCVPAKEFCEKG